MSPDDERRASVALSFLAKPGDPVLGAALRTRTAAGVLALVTGADADGEALLADQAQECALSRAVLRWRERLGEIPSTARLAAWQDGGLRLVMPGDAEWPTQLDDLGETRPLLLWLRGTADLRLTCVNSVAVVGARAATGYGQHVGIELAAALAEKDVGVISGGAYGTNSQQRSPPIPGVPKMISGRSLALRGGNPGRHGVSGPYSCRFWVTGNVRETVALVRRGPDPGLCRSWRSLRRS
jgi:DNA processing protein